jgi:hypothetical protein
MQNNVKTNCDMGVTYGPWLKKAVIINMCNRNILMEVYGQVTEQTMTLGC